MALCGNGCTSHPDLAKGGPEYYGPLIGLSIIWLGLRQGWDVDALVHPTFILSQLAGNEEGANLEVRNLDGSVGDRTKIVPKHERVLDSNELGQESRG